MASSSNNVLTLRTSDNQEFKVEESIAVRSQTVNRLVEDDCAAATIPLLNVTGAILAMVIEYLKKHAADPKDVSVDDLKEFDSEFLKVSYPVLFDLILAANYLEISDLLDITTQEVADRIKNKMPEEVREIFNITNDFTPEEEGKIRSENSWAFEI